MRYFNISDEEGLLKLISKDKPEINGEIKLMFDEMDPTKKIKFEKLLNKWFNACGCELGAIFSFVSTISYFIFTLVSSEMSSWILLRNGLIVIFLAALIGKIIGITVAKFRLKSIVKALVKQLRSEF